MISDKEKRVLSLIDENKEKIIEIANRVKNSAEGGFKEFKTSKLVKEMFEESGLNVTDSLAVTGVKGVLGDEDEFNVCLIGELDGIVCPEHKSADAVTGYAHACGHNAQIASLIGAAIGLSKGNAIDNGAVTFMAVPAEEYNDIEYRKTLKDEGKIEFFGGKQQLISEGVFDKTDVAVMVHAQPESEEGGVYVHAKSLGFVQKNVTFKGKSVHAANPYDGVNALNAASLAILGIHTNRERFRDEDKVRVHFIITKGGDVVNVVPSEVCLECQVRAANIPAMKKASEDVDSAIRGAAMMVGAEAEIETVMGYQPFNQDKALGELFKDVYAELVDNPKIHTDVDMTGSSDIGDLSHLIPTIQPMVGGFKGQLHSKEFGAADEYAAYVLPAKVMAVTAMRLLENNAEKGMEIKDGFKPTMTKEEYLKLLRGE